MTAGKVACLLFPPNWSSDEMPRLNRNANGRCPNVCRDLFGPVDHEENREFLSRELNNIQTENSERWNFDFELELPLPGRYEWEAVSEDIDRRTTVDIDASTGSSPGSGGGGGNNNHHHHQHHHLSRLLVQAQDAPPLLPLSSSTVTTKGNSESQLVAEICSRQQEAGVVEKVTNGEMVTGSLTATASSSLPPQQRLTRSPVFSSSISISPSVDAALEAEEQGSCHRTSYTAPSVHPLNATTLLETNRVTMDETSSTACDALQSPTGGASVVTQAAALSAIPRTVVGSANCDVFKKQTKVTG